MASSFRSEELDQGSVDEASDDGRNDDKVDAEPWHIGIDRVSNGAVIGVTGEEKREPADEVTKEDRPESAAGADHERDREIPPCVPRTQSRARR